MIAVIQQNGLHLAIHPGFSLDQELGVFWGQVIYGDEELTLCITKERMRQALEVAFTTDSDIEPLFHPTTWIDQAVSSYGMDNPDVYFEEADELGPDFETEHP
jgi:hypothetical protein